MKRVIIAMGLLICQINFCSAGVVGFVTNSGVYNNVPEPRLRYPIYDTVILTKDQPLEFKWWNEFTDTSGFILKIYEGFNMYADNLRLKKDLSAQASSFSVESGMFQDGQVYTWSLMRILFSGFKSAKSFNSFKVIKK